MICVVSSNSLKFRGLTLVGPSERRHFYPLQISFPANFLYFALVKYSKNGRIPRIYICFNEGARRNNLVKTCPLRLTLINFRGEHALAI